MGGDEIIRAWGLSDRISHNLDTEISPCILNPGAKEYISKLFPKVLRLDFPYQKVPISATYAIVTSKAPVFSFTARV